MKVSQGDYVILEIAKRSQLARCSAAPAEGKKGGYKAVLCKEKDTEKKTVLAVDFNLNEVKANLGRTPPVGSVYGQKVEPLLKTRPSKFWEEIRLYKHLDEESEAALVKDISTAYKKLAGLNLVGVRMILEVRQEQGKYAGYYKHTPKNDVDIMCVKPPTNLEGLHYIVWHEYGHGIWYRRMTPRQRLAWVQLYHEYIVLQEVTEKDLDDILDEVEASGSIGAFTKDADDQTLLIFKQILKQISQVHGLSKKHLDLALTQGESIEDYWPTSVELSEKEVSVTEYARKNPEELFAESFAHHVAGRKIPKKIQALMDLTLTKLTKPQGAVVATRRPDPSDDGDKKSSKKKKRKAGLK